MVGNRKLGFEVEKGNNEPKFVGEVIVNTLNRDIWLVVDEFRTRKTFRMFITNVKYPRWHLSHQMS